MMEVMAVAGINSAHKLRRDVIQTMGSARFATLLHSDVSTLSTMWAIIAKVFGKVSFTFNLQGHITHTHNTHTTQQKHT